ncbi:MAG: hypothetical protein ACI8XB_002603, partial [Patiriisocius sp.]
MFSINGKIKQLDDVVQVTDSFKKREVVLTQDSGQYPQHILFQMVQDNCNLVDGMAMGDEVKFHFDIRGREWTSPSGEVKFFNSLNVWRVEKVGAAAPVAETTAPAAKDAPPLPVE